MRGRVFCVSGLGPSDLALKPYAFLNHTRRAEYQRGANLAHKTLLDCSSLQSNWPRATHHSQATETAPPMMPDGSTGRPASGSSSPIAVP